MHKVYYQGWSGHTHYVGTFKLKDAQDKVRELKAEGKQDAWSEKVKV